jgi:hypothetical protein
MTASGCSVPSTMLSSKKQQADIPQYKDECAFVSQQFVWNSFDVLVVNALLRFGRWCASGTKELC